MFAKRLEILAAHLESIARLQESGVPRKRQFNMSVWFDTGVKPGECGTSACAMGEACFIQEFRALGLYLSRSALLGDGVPFFRQHRGFLAAELLFDITRDEAKHLFSKYAYTRHTDPAVVARRIRAFIVRGGRQPSRDEEFVPLSWVSGVDLCAG